MSVFLFGAGVKNLMTQKHKNNKSTNNVILQRNKTLVKPLITNLSNLEVDSKINELDITKIDIEDKKIELERDKLFVSSLIEDFKARWQELLNFESENSRWQTLYVTALILVISWVLSNSGESGKYKKIREIFDGDNSYLLLSLAVINALYTLAMAYKGYQIQEIAQYLYENIGSQISSKTSIEFNSWERWRRNETGSPKFIRTIYYVPISLLPTAVSTAILGLFYYHRYPVINSVEWLNAFFYFASIFVFITLCIALLTTIINNKRWHDILIPSKSNTKGVTDAGS